MPTTLAAGLPDPVHDAQVQFRGLLDAMSRPGRVVALRGGLPAAPAPLMQGTYALLLGLADHDASLWVGAADDGAALSLRFHTGVRVVDEPADATFAVVVDAAELPPLERFAQGEQDYPDRSTTVLVQVAAFGSGQGFRLQGPGIRGAVMLEVDGLPADFAAIMARNRQRFPLGVDLVLVAGTTIVGLPRSTVVEG